VLYGLRVTCTFVSLLQMKNILIFLSCMYFASDPLILSSLGYSPTLSPFPTYSLSIFPSYPSTFLPPLFCLLFCYYYRHYYYFIIFLFYFFIILFLLFFVILLFVYYYDLLCKATHTFVID
jgi:hypothetical protein